LGGGEIKKRTQYTGGESKCISLGKIKIRREGRNEERRKESEGVGRKRCQREIQKKN